MKNQELFLIMLQVGSLIVAGVIGYYAFVVRMSSRITAIETRCAVHVETLTRVGAMSRALEKVKADNALFWKVIEPHVAKIIHSPVHKTRDELVDKFIESRLTLAEALQLEEELREALQDPQISDEKRLAAALLLARVASIINGRTA